MIDPNEDEKQKRRNMLKEKKLTEELTAIEEKKRAMKIMEKQREGDAIFLTFSDSCIEI